MSEGQETTVIDRAQPQPPAPMAQGAMQIAQSKAVQEVQAMVFMAKQFPRSRVRAITALQEECQRPDFAKRSTYCFPKGGGDVFGPSIRFAEACSRHWGNMQCGVIELEQREGESVCMAYAWDLETNTKHEKTFTVPHIRYSKKLGNEVLTDPRDIYEMVANMGARRMRSCILALIPSDVVRQCMILCDKTLDGDETMSRPDKIQSAVEQLGTYSVTVEQIEARMLKNIDALNLHDLRTLGKIFTSMEDGMSKPGDWFGLDPDDGDGKSATERLGAKLGAEGQGGKGKGQGSTAKPKSGKRAPKKEDQQKPSEAEESTGGAPSGFDQLIDLMVGKYECKSEEAVKRITLYANNLFAKAPADMSPAQVDDIAAKIKSGEMKP